MSTIRSDKKENKFPHTTNKNAKLNAFNGSGEDNSATN